MKNRKLLDKLDSTNAGRGSPISPSGPDLFSGWKPIIRVDGASEEAEGTTVYVAADMPALPAGQIPLLAARISWGNEGAQVRAYLDVAQGAPISVHAAFVQVDVKNRENPGPGKVDIPVQGFIAYKPRRSNFFFPQFTAGVSTLAAGGSVTYPIPPFASSVYVYSLGATILIEALDPSGAVVTAWTGIGMSMPGNASHVRVTNLSSVDRVIPVIFTIDL